MAEFKDMLKYYRKLHKMSQVELAKALGLSTSTISMYEMGNREPSFEVEEHIADFFNVDLNTLRGKSTEDLADPELIEFYKKVELIKDEHRKALVLRLFSLMAQLTDEELVEAVSQLDYLIYKRDK